MIRIFVHDYLAADDSRVVTSFNVPAMPTEHQLIDIGFPNWHRVTRIDWRIAPRSGDTRTLEPHVYVAELNRLPIDYEVRTDNTEAALEVARRGREIPS